MTAHERQQVFATAVQQLRSSTVSELQVEAIRVIRESKCPSCRDPHSDPVFDGHHGMVCDICGEDWQGER